MGTTVKLIFLIAFTIDLSLTLPRHLPLRQQFNLGNNNLKVYDGDPAEPGQFPFIVAVNVFGYQNCGGSIVANKWVVTAAHCVVEYSSMDISVLSGTNLLDTGGILYNASKIIVYPTYNNSVDTDDIALIKVDGIFQYSDLVQTIEIGDVSGNELVTVIGWGETEDEVSPKQLQYANLTALTDDGCTKNSEGGDYIFPRGPGQVCALASEGISSCYGDSGGPLIFNGTLVGLVSYAVSPCARGYPDVYTRVGYYTDWIKETIENN